MTIRSPAPGRRCSMPGHAPADAGRVAKQGRRTRGRRGAAGWRRRLHRPSRFLAIPRPAPGLSVLVVDVALVVVVVVVVAWSAVDVVVHPRRERDAEPGAPRGRAVEQSSPAYGSSSSLARTFSPRSRSSSIAAPTASAELDVELDPACGAGMSAGQSGVPKHRLRRLEQRPQRKGVDATQVGVRRSSRAPLPRARYRGRPARRHGPRRLAMIGPNGNERVSAWPILA